MKHGTIVYLHGTSSSGKSSTARAFQEGAPEAWLHLSLDSFYDMLPSRLRTPDWPLYHQLCSGLHRCAVLWAEQGMNVIMDGVMERAEFVADAASILGPERAYFIGLFCPLDILEERERNRNDGPPLGLARYQFDRVHSHCRYDMALQTHSASPHENACRIASFISQAPPSAFKELNAAPWISLEVMSREPRRSCR